MRDEEDEGRRGEREKRTDEGYKHPYEAALLDCTTIYCLSVSRLDTERQ